MRDRAQSSRTKHDAMVGKKGILVDATVNVPAGDMVADFERCGIEIPGDVGVQGVGVDSAYRPSMIR